MPNLRKNKRNNFISFKSEGMFGQNGKLTYEDIFERKKESKT